jgi:Na+-driven multidrug efflux pump
MAAESLAVNGLLANQPDSTSLLATWSIFDRSVRFLAMPLIAVSVAMLPLAARLSGQGAVGALRRELKVGMRAGVVYVALFVTPLAILLGPMVARSLSDSEITAEYGASSMVWVPLAVFGFLPFLLARATFDGLQRPRPGLIASLVRAVVLVIPLVWLGMQFHDLLGVTLVDGACIGFGIGTTVSGIGLWIWTTRKLETECAAVRKDDGAVV